MFKMIMDKVFYNMNLNQLKFSHCIRHYNVF